MPISDVWSSFIESPGQQEANMEITLPRDGCSQKFFELVLANVQHQTWIQIDMSKPKKKGVVGPEADTEKQKC